MADKFSAVFGRPTQDRFDSLFGAPTPDQQELINTAKRETPYATPLSRQLYTEQPKTEPERTFANIEEGNRAKRRARISEQTARGGELLAAEEGRNADLRAEMQSKQAQRLAGGGASFAQLSNEQEAMRTVEDADYVAEHGPADTWDARIAKSMRQNWAGFKQQAAGIAQAGAEHAALALAPAIGYSAAKTLQPLADQALAPVVKGSQKVYADAKADIAANQYDFGGRTDYYLQNIADSLVQMVPTVAAAYLTRGESLAAEGAEGWATSANPIKRFLGKYAAELKDQTGGLSVLGAQQGGQKYGESRAAGRTVGQSDADAIVFGLAEALPEALPLGAMMKKGGHFLPRLLKTSGMEGASEVLTQAVEDGYSVGFLNEKMTWGEARQHMIDAGIIGFGMGLGMGGAGHGVDKAREVFARMRAPTAPGAIETATEQSQATPEDDASPLSGVLDLGHAKTLMAGATAKLSADEILTRNKAPTTGTMVELGGHRWTIDDAFTDEHGEDGLTLSREGQKQKVYFGDLNDAGIGLIPIADPRSKGEPSPMNRTVTAPEPSGEQTTKPASGREEFMRRVRRAENASGDPNAQNPNSSASGIYQFTDPTFDAYYRKVYGAPAPEGAKNNSEVQQRLMEQMTSDNEARLKKAGFDPTTGHLYLAHFAGPQGAINLLRNPNGSAATLLGAKAANANASIIKGKTGAEVIAWADRKMGEATSPTSHGTAYFPDGTPAEPTDDSEFDFLNQPLVPERAGQAAPAPIADQPLLTEPALDDGKGDGSRVAPRTVETAADLDLVAPRVNTEPTPAQAEASNYQHAHIQLHGMDIAIENPKGSTRRGIDENGQPWETTMDAAHYGRVKGTLAADGEHVDVYVGPNPTSNRVFVVDQYDPKTGKFDETKSVLGADSQEEAQAIYDKGFSDGSGPTRRGSITEMSVDGFKSFIAERGHEPASGVDKIAPVASPEPIGQNDDSGFTRDPSALRGGEDMAAERAGAAQPDSGEAPASAPAAGIVASGEEGKPSSPTDNVSAPAEAAPLVKGQSEDPDPISSSTKFGLVKDEGARIDAARAASKPVLDIKGSPTGWLSLPIADTSKAILVSSTENRSVMFDDTHADARAQAFAMDNPQFQSIGDGPAPELVAKSIFGGEESPAIPTRSESPAETFDPEPHIEKLRAYIKEGSGTLNDIDRIAKHLGLPVDQAHAVMGAVASRPNAGFRMTKGRPAVYRKMEMGGGRTKPVLVKKAVPPRYIRNAVAKRDMTPMEFVRSQGGIQSGQHDLRNLGDLKSHPGVINSKGRSVDEIGRALHEAGYFENRDPSDPDQRPTEAETLDFLAEASKRRQGQQEEPREDEARAAAAERVHAALQDPASILPRAITDADREAIVDHMLATGDDAADAAYAHFERLAVEAVSAAKQETGDDFYDIPFDIGAPDERDSQSDRAQAEENGDRPAAPEGVAGPGEEARADNGADGEGQLDAFGTRAGDQREALERKGEGRKQSDKAQKAPGSDGGLFDDNSQTGQLFDAPRAKPNELQENLIAEAQSKMPTGWKLDVNADGSISTTTPEGVKNTYDRVDGESLGDALRSHVRVAHLKAMSDPISQAKAALQQAMDALDGKPAEPKVPEPAAPIEDFGEELIGARKHTYTAAYQDKMEAAAKVDIAAAPLAKSWPEPNYDKLIEDGADPEIVAFVHALRDEIPTKPSKSWKLKGWVDSVTMFRRVSEQLISGEIATESLKARRFSPEFARLGGFFGRADLYREVGHDHSLKGVTFGQRRYSLYRGERDVTKWVVGKEQGRSWLAAGAWPPPTRVKRHSPSSRRSWRTAGSPRRRAAGRSSRFTRAAMCPVASSLA
jgi:hypothetical protein